jgi:hypothetical protein
MLMYSRLPVNMERQLRREVRDGIRDLEEFTEHVTEFATWWNWIKIDASAQYSRTEEIQIKYDSLYQNAVIEKWKTLQNQFASYNDQV